MSKITTEVKWTPFTKISILNRKRALISNSMIKKKVSIDINTLRDIIDGNTTEKVLKELEKIGLINNDYSDIEKFQDGLDKWTDCGWGNCLNFYFSSRDIPYFDKDDSTEKKDKREKVLKEFLLEGNPTSKDDLFYSINLPEPQQLDERKKLGSLLTKRVSVRRYKGHLNLNELSDLLWYGFLEVRVNRKGSNELIDLLKSYGAAFEIYLCIYSVDDLKEGLYKYNLLYRLN